MSSQQTRTKIFLREQNQGPRPSGPQVDRTMHEQTNWFFPRFKQKSFKTWTGLRWQLGYQKLLSLVFKFSDKTRKKLSKNEEVTNSNEVELSKNVDRVKPTLSENMKWLHPEKTG